MDQLGRLLLDHRLLLLPEDHRAQSRKQGQHRGLRRRYHALSRRVQTAKAHWRTEVLLRQSRANGLEKTPRLLNTSAKQARSSGAARISLGDTRPTALASRASQLPLGLVRRSAEVVASTSRSSRSTARAVEVEAEAARSYARRAAVICVINTLGPRRNQDFVSRERRLSCREHIPHLRLEVKTNDGMGVEQRPSRLLCPRGV